MQKIPMITRRDDRKWQQNPRVMDFEMFVDINT